MRQGKVPGMSFPDDGWGGRLRFATGLAEPLRGRIGLRPINAPEFGFPSLSLFHFLT